MELKKNPQADLDKSRSVFILVGLVFAVGLLFTLFSWRTESGQLADLGNKKLEQDSEMAEITKMDEPKPPEPPQEEPQVEQKTEVIDIIADDSDNEDNSFFDSEASEDDKVDLIENDFEEEVTDIPFVSVEKMPEYPGGELAMRRHIAENIVYPQQALENDVQGTVHLRFVVLRSGKVGKIEIIRGVDPLLDKEAERVVKTLKNFTPGEQGGKKVKVWFSVPIVFKINN